MSRRIVLVCSLVLLALLIIGCQSADKESSKLGRNNKEAERVAFDESYRPLWWDNITGSEYLYSYAYMDGADQEEIKVKAIGFAQTRLLHYKKDYIVNLTELILDESDSRENFRARQLGSINGLIYNTNYAQYLKRFETEYVERDENEFRCFVAIGLPIVELQNKYVHQFQKNPTIAGTFAKSATYLNMLEQAGLTALPAPKQLDKVVHDESETTNSDSKYDEDVVPAWFKISYNNLKVMVNRSTIASTAEQAERQAIAQCHEAKIKVANDFARAEAERYRKASGYDEIEFNEVKNAISQKVTSSNYSLTQEHIKTLNIAEKRYVTYAQYSLNKRAIQNILVEVLKQDDLLYSRLRSSMAFDDLDEEF